MSQLAATLVEGLQAENEVDVAHGKRVERTAAAFMKRLDLMSWSSTVRLRAVLHLLQFSTFHESYIHTAVQYARHPTPSLSSPPPRSPLPPSVLVRGVERRQCFSSGREVASTHNGALWTHARDARERVAHAVAAALAWT